MFTEQHCVAFSSGFRTVVVDYESRMSVLSRLWNQGDKQSIELIASEVKVTAVNGSLRDNLWLLDAADVACGAHSDHKDLPNE